MLIACKSFSQFQLLTRLFSHSAILEVTVNLTVLRCLAAKRCSVSGLNCRYLTLCSRLKITELVIKIYQNRMSKSKNRRISRPLNVSIWIIFEKLQVRGNLFVCRQIWTVATIWHINIKNMFAIFFIFWNIFLSESDFFYAHSIFFSLFRKCSVTFRRNWISWLQNADMFFSALDLETKSTALWFGVRTLKKTQTPWRKYNVKHPNVPLEILGRHALRRPFKAL